MEKIDPTVPDTDITHLASDPSQVTEDVAKTSGKKIRFSKVLLGGLALLVIGAFISYFIFTQGGSNTINNSSSPQAQVTATQSPSPTTQNDQLDWEKFSDPDLGFSFSYPTKLKLSKDSTSVTLNHSIAYKNHGACDMMGDTKTYDYLDDFNVKFEIISVKPELLYIDGQFEAGILKGEYAVMGAEGCGVIEYYFPLQNGKYLKVIRDQIQALSSVIVEEKRQEVLRVPGVISQEESDTLFEQILTSFSLIKVTPI